jgi:peroxiredoxin family protein
MRSGLAIFLHSHSYDRVYQAVSLALSASSLGRPVHLFLFYQALATYIDGTWDDIRIEDGPRGPAGLDTRIEEGFESANLPSLYKMLAKAREEEGGTRVYACSSSVRVVGADPAAVRERVDEIVGLTSMLKIAESGNQVLYI